MGKVTYSDKPAPREELEQGDILAFDHASSTERSFFMFVGVNGFGRSNPVAYSLVNIETGLVVANDIAHPVHAFNHIKKHYAGEDAKIELIKASRVEYKIHPKGTEL